MNNDLLLRNDRDRLYASRKEEGRGITITEDYVNASIQRLKNYFKKNKD